MDLIVKHFNELSTTELYEICFGGGDWLMMYGDPTFEGNLKWLTLGTAAILVRGYQKG